MNPGAGGVRRVAAALALFLLAPPAAADGSESRFYSLTASARSQYGRPAYAIVGDLIGIARRHSQQMAARHAIYHNPNLGSEVPNWQAVGENVGMGGTPESIHRALMNSASHRSNILDTDFTQIGIGTAYDEDGVLYVTQVFRQPLYAAAPVVARPVRRPAHVTPPPAPRPPDPQVVLARKLATARQLVRKAAPTGAVDHALTFVLVMATLAE